MAEPARRPAPIPPGQAGNYVGTYAAPIRGHARPCPRRPPRSTAPLWLAAAVLLVGLGLLFGWRAGRVPVMPPPAAPAAGQAAPAPPAGAAPVAPERPRAETPPAREAEPASAPPGGLRVLAVSPTHRTFNYRDVPVTVEFSRAVKPDTVAAAFRIVPATGGALEWPTAARLVFRPDGLWAHAATYVVTLGSGITDPSGLDQLEPMSWEFSTVGGYFFSRDIRPLLAVECAGCHQRGGAAARVPLATHGDAMRWVVAGDAGRSRLVTALEDQNHRGRLSPEARRRLYRVRDWITLNRAAD
ncbi:MAG: Ig-like domain-containing protein [Candidatus Methylomirabilales bacterium]